MPSAVDRKVVLARLLAVAEAERCGLSPTEDEVMATARWWRREFGLCDLHSFAAWLQHSGLDLVAFFELMREFAALTKVLEHRAEQVDARMDDQRAIHSVWSFCTPERA